MKQVVTLCVAACGLLPFAAMAQQEGCSHTLNILVSEAKTNERISGALIGSGEKQTLTDPDGFARLEQVCSGLLHLHVQDLGYEVVDKDITFSDGDTIHIIMKTSGQTLDDVEIVGHKQVINTTTTVTTLNQQDLDKLKGGNLATMLKGIAGVNVIQTGATIGKPVVNGMYSNRLLLLNNGIRQEGQQWGSEHAPEIDPFIAQNISVVKGAEAIRYGAEAIGGVIIVEPPALPKDSVIHGELNLVGASNGRSGTVSGMLSGNFRKAPALSWRVQGTAKRSGNIETADYFLDNTGSKELNYSAALGYSKAHFGLEAFYSHFNTELGIFSGAHIGSIEDLQARIANGRPFDDGTFTYTIGAPKQQVVHDLLKLNGHVHLNDYLHFNIQYGFQKDSRQEYDRRRGGRTSLPSLDLTLFTHTLDASLEYFNGGQWKATVGLNGLYQDNASVAGTFTTPLIPDYVSKGAGAYAIGKLLKNNYELEAGIRYDYKFLNALGYRNKVLYGGKRDFHNVSASIGGIWHLSPYLDIRSNAGTAWRAPTVNELYSNGLHHGAAAFELGDSTLKSEQSLKWITSVQYKNPGNWLHLDMDVYANYFSNYIYLQPSDSLYESIRGAFPTFSNDQTNARFLGADLTARVTFLKQFDYTVKGSVIRAKDLTNDRFLPMIPADKLEHSIRWRYDAVPFLKETYLQLAHVFVARQTRYESNSDYAPPPAAYHLLNLSMGTEIKTGRHDLSVNFAIDNLTNTLYKDYLNRFRYYAHDIGRNYTIRLTYRI